MSSANPRAELAAIRRKKPTARMRIKKGDTCPRCRSEVVSIEHVLALQHVHVQRLRHEGGSCFIIKSRGRRAQMKAFAVLGGVIDGTPGFPVYVFMEGRR